MLGPGAAGCSGRSLAARMGGGPIPPNPTGNGDQRMKNTDSQAGPDVHHDTVVTAGWAKMPPAIKKDGLMRGGAALRLHEKTAQEEQIADEERGAGARNPDKPVAVKQLTGGNLPNLPLRHSDRAIVTEEIDPQESGDG